MIDLVLVMDYQPSKDGNLQFNVMQLPGSGDARRYFCIILHCAASAEHTQHNRKHEKLAFVENCKEIFICYQTKIFRTV